MQIVLLVFIILFSLLYNPLASALCKFFIVIMHIVMHAPRCACHSEAKQYTTLIARFFKYFST